MTDASDYDPRTGDILVPLADARRAAQHERHRPPRRPGAGGPQQDFRPVRIDLVSPTEWAGRPIPDRPWIVPGWIPSRQVTMLGGDGGLGKSLCAMQLMVAAALGEPWLGHRVEPCRSLGIFCEDDIDELHRRTADVARHHGRDLDDLGDIMMTSMVARDACLVHFPPNAPAEPSDLYGTILNQAMGMGARIVVLDSLHDLFVGNEINRGHARAFIGALREIAVEIGGAVILTAHPSLSGRASGTGESGSTAWGNAVRSRLYLTKPEDGDRDARVLARKKANYSSANDEIRMTWRAGVFVAEEGESGLFGSIKRSKVETDFLATLDRLAGQGRYVTASPNSPNYAPKAMRQHARLRHSKRDLEAAMNDLFDKGEIIVGTVKTEQRKTVSAIVRKPGSEAS